VGRWLSHFAELGSEQGSVDGPCPLERLGVDGDVDQGIEPTDGANVARFGSFTQEVLGLAVDALTTGTLGVDGLVERTIAIQQGTHQTALLPVGVFDAALARGKLLMRAGLCGASGKEERTAKTLGPKAIGVLELVRGVHAQAGPAVWRAIRVARHFFVAMVVEQDGCDA